MTTTTKPFTLTPAHMRVLAAMLEGSTLIEPGWDERSWILAAPGAPVGQFVRARTVKALLDAELIDPTAANNYFYTLTPRGRRIAETVRFAR